MNSSPDESNPTPEYLKGLFLKTLDFCSRLSLLFGKRSVEFVFFGGEPFLFDRELIFFMLEELFKRNSREDFLDHVRITTNLTFLEKVKEVVFYYPQVRISTSFDPVIRFSKEFSLSRWVENYKELTCFTDKHFVDFTLTRHLLSFPLKEFILTNEIRNFSIGLLTHSGRAKKYWKNLCVPLDIASNFLQTLVEELPGDYTVKFIENVRLSGIKCHLSCASIYLIDVSGKVYLGNNCISERELGNIFSNSFDKIIFSHERLRLLEFVPEECKDCGFFEICRGGCFNLRVYGMSFAERECPGLRSFLRKVLL